MLPDYPEHKNKIQKRVIENIMLSDPFANEFAHIIVFEGTKTQINRPNEESDMNNISRLEVTSSISFEEYKNMTYDQVFMKYLESFKELTNKKNKLIIDTMNQVTEKTGNVVDAKGQKLSPDLLLEDIERIHLSFDKNGNPELYKYRILVGNPKLADDINTAFQELQTKPEYIPKYNEIIERKRKEWNAREASRKLVD